MQKKITSENEGLGYTSTQSFDMGFTDSIKACSAFLGELKAKLVLLLGKQQDTFVTRMPGGLRLRAEGKVVELEVFAPPLYSSFTVASLAE